MKKFLNIALLLSFWVTIMVPVTGILIHKLASAVFLLLSIVHTIVYRKRMSRKRWGLLIILLLAFFTGLWDDFRRIPDDRGFSSCEFDYTGLFSGHSYFCFLQEI